MTAELAFRAREMSAAGLWSGRIADLLGVEPGAVQAALNGRSFEVEPSAAPGSAPVPVEPAAVEVPVESPLKASRDWPPPIDSATEWDEVRISRGYGVAPDVVRVRWVRLWGQRVRINAAGQVWCHCCLRFRTTEQLSHPFNGCPVGLPARSGTIVHLPDTTVDDGPRYLPVDGASSAWEKIARGKW
jgi:hypothetical protein